MPEQPIARVARRVSRMMGPVVCALPLCGIPAGAIAQSVPPGLRACAAETDAGQRLDCYDREMARLLTPPAQPAAAPPPPASTPPPPQPAPPPPPAVAPAAKASTLAPPQPAAADTETPAPHRSSIWKSFVGGGSSRVTAHIASLDRSPNSMVLHLDNGQVWQQTGRASGDLSLKVGDSVTIEKHLGSYWLSSRYVSDMKVRLQPQPAP